MARYRYVVLTNPVAGREEDYNRWYDEQHLGDVLSVPGFVAAQRFRVAEDDAQAKHKYLAIYEIETEDLPEVFAELRRRAGTPRMPMSDALNSQEVSATLYRAITDRMTGEGGR